MTTIKILVFNCWNDASITKKYTIVCAAKSKCDVLCNIFEFFLESRTVNYIHYAPRKHNTQLLALIWMKNYSSHYSMQPHFHSTSKHYIPS